MQAWQAWVLAPGLGRPGKWATRRARWVWIRGRACAQAAGVSAPRSSCRPGYACGPASVGVFSSSILKPTLLRPWKRGWRLEAGLQLPPHSPCLQAVLNR
jgi:hypothetical protein